MSSSLRRIDGNQSKISQSFGAMPRLYLLVNAALYLLLAVLCTVKHQQTSRGTGYVQLDSGGHSEYLVIYGGLQLGIAIFFFLLSRDVSTYRIGILFSLVFYAPIVLYRITTLLIYRPTSPVTLGTAVLELTLLIWAILAWRSLPDGVVASV